MQEFLRKVPLFAGLPEQDLAALCEMVEEIRLAPGQELFAEGSPGDRAYVIEEGQLEIFRRSSGREVLLALRGQGEVIGEMALLQAQPRNASARARVETLLIAIQQSQLDQLLDTSPSAARAMLHTVLARQRSDEALLRQSEKLAQLGMLTAGVAHELNNPASAVRRGADQLRASISRWGHASAAIGNLRLDAAGLDTLNDLEQLAGGRAARPELLDALDRSDREYEIESWLEDNDLPDAWELAPALVNLVDIEKLETLREIFAANDGGPSSALAASDTAGPNPRPLPAVLPWLAATYTVQSLLVEIGQGAERLSEIVKALKSYSYMDQAPVQNVDIHEGLDNTLVLLRGKLKNIRVHRDYAADLPGILAYGSELNQVWTNLLDNAADALQGAGEGKDIFIRTRRSNGWITVEVEDNGPGMPEAVRARVFDPFFTTKGPGKGTGLGLYISYNIVVQKHRGDIKVFSQPGKTCFQVMLPVNFEATGGGPPLAMTPKLEDDEIRNILESARTIAVVGISARASQPSNSVPAYLQAHGYRIIPVNPKLDALLGEKAYPDLAAVDEPVDVALLFRRSEDVPAIVEQAIAAGVKVVWMQEGIVNEQAANVAREAGLQVVMDACMRTNHRRLMRSA